MKIIDIIIKAIFSLLPERKEVYVFNIVPVSDFLPFLWLAKVGFSGDAVIRAAEVERSILEKTGISVKVVPFIKVKVFSWRLIEKTTHGILAFYRTDKFKPASGWSEIFRVINVLSAAAVMVLLAFLGVEKYQVPGLVVAVIPWPLDCAAIVLFFAILELAMIIGAIMGAGWILLTYI